MPRNGMEGWPSGEYDHRKQASWYRRVGALVCRWFSPGDDDALGLRRRSVGAMDHVGRLLDDALYLEGEQALTEAERLIAAVDDGRVPFEAPADCDADSIRVVVGTWLARNQEPYEALRRATAIADNHLDELEDDELMGYCSLVLKFQRSLRNYVDGHLSDPA